ncbi:hypothetical protein, partial [Pseudomonas aeruginosa]|uniref:hypothetical protein n=1 Tax=Pseudomonas aeruginosa TaxID=287 RepID=UPI0039795CFC
HHIIISPVTWKLKKNKNDKTKFALCIMWTGFLGGAVVKNLPQMQGTQEMRVQYLGWEDFLEEEIATHSS